jgi:hypothetical protein
MCGGPPRASKGTNSEPRLVEAIGCNTDEDGCHGPLDESINLSRDLSEILALKPLTCDQSTSQEVKTSEVATSTRLPPRLQDSSSQVDLKLLEAKVESVHRMSMVQTIVPVYHTIEEEFIPEKKMEYIMLKSTNSRGQRGKTELRS